MSKCTCDFHHEHPWQRWVKSSKNRLTMGEQKMLLDLMQAITRAWMENSYQKAVDSLRKSKMYTGNTKVQEYCGKVWLDRSDHWARAFCVQLYGNWQKVTQNSLQLTIRDLSAIPSYTTRCLRAWPLSSGHQNRKLAGLSSSPQHMAHGTVCCRNSSRREMSKSRSQPWKGEPDWKCEHTRQTQWPPTLAPVLEKNVAPKPDCSVSQRCASQDNITWNQAEGGISMVDIDRQRPSSSQIINVFFW